MTCIVALSFRGTVYMGADSGSVLGDLVSQIDEPKLWQRGELLFGDCGSVRGSQVVRHKFALPPLQDDLHAYFATAFFDALHPLLSKESYLEMLVGVRGKIFRVHPDGAVTHDPETPYAAIGSGAQVALGALYACCSMKPQKALERALRAAKHHVGGIQEPFIFAQNPPDPQGSSSMTGITSAGAST